MTPSSAHAYCTEKTKNSGSNFYYSFLFLPRPRREAMYAVYTFCHEVDDAIDHPPTGANPQEQLSLWRHEVRAMYKGHPSFPVTISLAEHAQRLGIPEEYFQELLNGMEMDLATTRYQNFEALYPYCYRVASIVGLICLKVFGTQYSRANEYAINLGVAFQLTNILRDIGADAERNRIYLPQEDMARFGYSEEALLARTYSLQFIEMMEFEYARACDFYQKAKQIYESLPKRDRKSLIPAEIMQAVYFRILLQIKSQKYQVFGHRITLSPSHRLSIAIMKWLRSFFETTFIMAE